MNNALRSPSRVAVLLVGLLSFAHVVAADPPNPAIEKQARRATVQSELDYLHAAKQLVSIELTQVTLKEAYDGIARKAAINITYEGTLYGGAKHDVSFKGVPLKELLGKLGDTFKLTYRVDGPDKLTVIGAKAS